MARLGARTLEKRLNGEWRELRAIAAAGQHSSEADFDEERGADQ